MKTNIVVSHTRMQLMQVLMDWLLLVVTVHIMVQNFYQNLVCHVLAFQEQLITILHVQSTQSVLIQP